LVLPETILADAAHIFGRLWGECSNSSDLTRILSSISAVFACPHLISRSGASLLACTGG